MRMGTVKSSLIAKVGFSGDAKTPGILRIELRDGSTLDYPGTSLGTVKRLVQREESGQILQSEDSRQVSLQKSVNHLPVRIT